MKGGKCDTIVLNWMTQFKYRTGKKCLKPPLETFSFQMELILKPSSTRQMAKEFLMEVLSEYTVMSQRISHLQDDKLLVL